LVHVLNISIIALVATSVNYYPLCFEIFRYGHIIQDIMANPESQQVERIVRTRELVDPGQTGILVGTSGIALYFKGFEWPVKPVGDVDLVMRDAAALAEAADRLKGMEEIRSANYRTLLIAGKPVVLHNKLEIVPRDLNAFLPAQMFLPSADRYSSMSSAQAYEQRVTEQGEVTLPLDTLLEWKMRALRPKDKSDGVQLTEFAITHELVSPVAASSLREVIERVRKTAEINRGSYGSY
jgi:hypothetical protein